jgi:hypothetical protein
MRKFRQMSQTPLWSGQAPVTGFHKRNPAAAAMSAAPSGRWKENWNG